jgi:hypothetical protein
MPEKKEVPPQPPAYTLKEVTPQGFKVTFNKKEYVVRIYNTNDQCYFEEKYGIGFFNGVLSTKPSVILSEIAHHLITCDEEGNKIPDTSADFPTLEVFRRISPTEMGRQNLFMKTMLARGQALEPTLKEAQPKKGESFRKATRVG